MIRLVLSTGPHGAGRQKVIELMGKAIRDGDEDVYLDAGIWFCELIREDIRRHIGQTDLSWALTPADDPPRSYRVFRGSGLWTVIKLIISVMLVPVLLALVFALTVLSNLSLFFKILLGVIVFVAVFV